MTSKMKLQQLSDLELELYNQVISVSGTMEEKEIIISKMGIFDEYKKLHKEYANISSENLEAIKRGLFIQWYSVTEPSCFTGINCLDDNSEEQIIKSIDKLLEVNGNDMELDWMIRHYRVWDYAFERFKRYKKFYNEINNPISVEMVDFDKKEMHNRGQMGIYWSSIIK